MLEKYDKFIDLLPKIIPSFVSLLFFIWIAIGLLTEKMKSSFPDDPIFYGGMTPTDLVNYFFTNPSNPPSFILDVQSAVPWIVLALLFYFCEKYTRTQRSSTPLITFKNFVKKIQWYGLYGSLAITTGFILSAGAEEILFSHSDFFSGMIIPGYVGTPFIFIFVSASCFVYSIIRYELLKGRI